MARYKDTDIVSPFWPPSPVLAENMAAIGGAGMMSRSLLDVFHLVLGTQIVGLALEQYTSGCWGD